jgi:hypothetical protein
MNTKKIEELKKQLGSEHETSASWLKNQFPAEPQKRYSKLTYLNYQTLEEVFGKEAAYSLKQYLEKHPEEKVVVLATLTPKGRANPKPRLFAYPESAYYGQYELFAASAHLSGFVEVFHNFEPLLTT